MAAGARGAESCGGSLLSKALFNTLSMRLAAAALVLSFFLPVDGLGVDLCWFKGLFGLPCPGCGLTRSLTNVSHLDLGRALAYHPFGPLIWTLVVFLAVAGLAGPTRRARMAAFLDRHASGARVAYLGFVYAFVAFGVFRLAVTLLWSDAFTSI